MRGTVSVWTEGMHLGNFAAMDRRLPAMVRIIVVLCGMMVLPGMLHAQRFYVRLGGVVTDYFTAEPIKGVTIRLIKAGNTEAEVITRRDGRYFFTLDRGWRYTVYFSAKGKVTKHVVVNTEEVPPYPDVPFFDMDLQITMFDRIERFDFTPFEAPLGEAAYKPKLRNMSWDVEYTERLRPVLSKVMDDYEKTVKGYFDRTRTGRRPRDLRVEAPGLQPTDSVASPQAP